MKKDREREKMITDSMSQEKTGRRKVEKMKPVNISGQEEIQIFLTAESL